MTPLPTQEQLEDVRKKLPRVIQALDSIAEKTFQANRLLAIGIIMAVIGLGTGAIGIYNADRAADNADKAAANLEQTQALATIITDCLNENAESGGACAKRNARNQALILQAVGELIEIRRNETEIRIARACTFTDNACKERERGIIRAEEQAKLDEVYKQMADNRLNK